MLKELLHHPRKLWLRRALFQVHLWLGVLLALYVIVIGLTGSIVVFQDEIRHASLKARPFDANKIAAPGAVLQDARQREPASHVIFLSLPREGSPVWSVYLEDPGGHDRTLYADATTGRLLSQQKKLLIDYILELHVGLLMGTTGFIINCCAGIGLLLLALTGAILWWPGIRIWTRGFSISLQHSWKRINYDAHNAVGIWTLAIVSWWGITAVYFLLPKQVSAVVNTVSPLVGMKEPVAPPSSATGPIASIDAIIASYSRASSGNLAGIAIPAKPGDNITLYIDTGKPGDFSHRDILTFDGHTGKLLTTWHYGQKHSLGDWFLWLMYPLHFGTLWGTPFKVLWSLLGFSLPVLSITGLLMYWNRYLGKRWRLLSGTR